ncbi:MAG: OmpA family protein [Acidobacteria bacterium]|nr:OmpA family protein [Acidobacteriota bacterium]
MSDKKRRLRLLALAAIVGIWAGTASAQDDDARPAGVTLLGDTGLWFVPTAEVVRDGGVAASGHLSTFNRQQGLTAIQSIAGTFAFGVRDRVEVFGSVPLLTRIDRDVRPLFRPDNPPIGGVLPDFPFARRYFSGNAMGDVVVGAKVNLATERTRSPVAFAVRGWGRLATGDEDAGTTAGAPAGAVGLVLSKNLGIAEFGANADVVLRGDPSGVDVPHGMWWGVGLGVPVRGPLRVFGELLGRAGLGDGTKLTEPLVAADGSLSGLSSSERKPLDVVVGAEFQVRGVSAGAGLSWAARHVARPAVGQSKPAADRLGFLLRVSYHPGVRVYTPPPPPPPPPPPANRPPVVSVSCDPCEVEFGDEVRLRADASDPDGDPLAFRWSAPAGNFTDATDRATTRWQAPVQEGPVPITATVTDGRGGSASDAATVLVNAPPPPPRREFVFEDIHFDFDRYSLRPGAARVLDEVVAALAEDPDLGIQIEGHTCNIGTNEYNLALGDRRASSVQEYLTERGVSAARLQTISYGEERPAHDNAREETRRLNRRAALVVRMQ